jgi:hypothetical protein
MLHLLLQTTQPLINRSVAIKALWGGIVGLALGVYHDLNNYGQAPAGAVFNWKLFIAHAGGGAIAGALGAVGIGVATAS